MTGDGARCSQHVELFIHSSRGQEVSVVILDGRVLGSHNLCDSHIQTLILFISIPDKSKKNVAKWSQYHV